MDKKTYLGILCILVALGLMGYQVKLQKDADEQYRKQLIEQAQAAEAAAAANPKIAELTEANADAKPLPAPDTAVKVDEMAEEELVVLENDFIKATFTTHGGALKEVSLKEYPVNQGSDDTYVFNSDMGGSILPAMALTKEVPDGAASQYIQPYAITDQAKDSVTFSRTEAGVTYVRTYKISHESDGAKPYTVEHSTQVINRSGVAFNPGKLYFSVGTAAPDEADHLGFNLNAGYYDGDHYDYERLSKFKGGGFLFFKSEPKDSMTFDGSIVWAAVKNQFFTGILTPETPADSVYMKPVDFPHVDTSKPAPKGITESLEVDAGSIAAGTSKSYDFHYYVGPKEYNRLVDLGQDQDLVMQFGWFGFLGKLFLWLLLNVQAVVVNWGVAIMLITIFLRMCMWPLTAKAARSSKAMQKLQEPMKELREKYKDNPTKLNQEMMKMWKTHKVNPMAGCLPIFIQIPIFISFYYMLRSAPELRFAHFLWISDLSLPDTIAHIGGFPVNLLPLLMGITMFFQMRLQPTPTVDNAQVKMMRFMPLIFLLFCYNFSSGLVLYWTTSNLMSIIQQLYTNHHHYKDEDEVPEAEVVPAGNRKHQGKANVKKRKKS
jgi:YidC/Oxa1 family membrane protein insertase